MKFRIKKRNAVLCALNAAAIIGSAVLTAVGSSSASAQKYNFASERWNDGGKDRYSQLSCFLTDDSGFSTDSVRNVRGQLLNELKNISVVPEEGKKLCPDAYSAVYGKAMVRCDVMGRSEAELTAVGGDFFLFHDFTLLDGSFFTESDVMQDGAVIDRALAWELYGSENVAGMNIYIDGVKCYISGVVAPPETDYEKKCIGKTPQAYISYDMADILSGGSYSEFGESSGFDRITCYECIVPEPVENFGSNKLKDIFQQYGDNAQLVRNDGRFAPSKRAKELKKLPSYAVRDNTIRFPWWENASRMTEFYLTYLYAARRILLAVPTLTAVWLLILLARLYHRKKPAMKKKLSRKAENLKYKLISRKTKEEKQ